MSFDVIARGLANRAQADLAQLGKSATTRSLIAAIRSNGMFPKPLALAPAADVPAVTLGAANAASALNGRAAGNPLVLLSDARLQWLSGPRSQDSNQAWQSRACCTRAARCLAARSQATPKPTMAATFSVICCPWFRNQRCRSTSWCRPDFA